MDNLITDENHWVFVCKIGQGADCCRYLIGGANGFECAKHTDLKTNLDWRVSKGMMNARGDNCPGIPVTQ